MLPPGDGEDIFIWFYNPKFDAFHRKKEAGSLGEYWMLHHITNLKTSIAGLLEQLNYPAMPATEGGKSFFCALLVPKIVRDESGAFKMTPGCKKAWEHTKLEKAKECEGICIIDQTQSELFEDSYQDCQRKKMDPLLSLSDATREKLETFRLTPYAKIAYRMELEHEYTQQSLLRNGIYYWEDAGLDTLPDFVVAKINQIESRRDWLDWNPNGIDYLRALFDDPLNLDEFAVLKQPDSSSEWTSALSTAPSPNAPTVYDQSCPLNNSQLTDARTREAQFLASRDVDDQMQGLEKGVRALFTPVVRWAKLISKEGIIFPESDSGNPGSWPHNMGILVSCPPRKGEEMRNLALIHPQSDACIFHLHAPLLLVEIDSNGQKRAYSTETDQKQGLVHAAFIVRSFNIALGITTFCLPIIWVDKDQTARCYLVYQNDSQIIAYPFNYNGVDEFDLTVRHSRAHFHLRLLNILDSHMRPLSQAQDKIIGDVFSKFPDVASVPQEAPHKKRKICGQATHDDCHIHIVDKLGVHYVRKTLVRSGDREIAVYKHLLHYQFEDHYPGIQHFIYTWSTGYWKHNGAQYLELPYFLPVGDELRKEQGSCLQGMSLSLCDQLLTAVNFLHSVVKVAHMDIKPDNLVLDAGETLKVIDFNLSIVDATCDVPPGRCGTKGYMAPEVEGPGLYSPVLADLYSCGICMDDFLDMDQEQRQNWEKIEDRLFETFEVFATRLCNQSPSERPPLTERPRLQSQLQRDKSGMALGEL